MKLRVQHLRERARSLCSDLGDPQRRRLGDYDICAPVHIRDYWVEPLDLHQLVITHFTRSRDDEIEVVGPLSYPYLRERLEEDLSDPLWEQTVTQERYDIQNFGEGRRPNPETIEFQQVLRGHLSTFFRNIRTLAFIPDPPGNPGFKSGTKAPSDVLFMQYWGPHADVDPQAIAERAWNPEIHEATKPPYVPDLKVEGKAVPDREPPPPRDRDHDGFWTYLYPPLTIGKPPDPEPTQLIPRRTRRPMDRPPGRFVSIDEDLTVSHDGFVDLEEADASKARARLNLLCFALTQLGYRSHAIHPRDLAGYAKRENQDSGTRYRRMGPLPPERKSAGKAGDLKSHHPWPGMRAEISLTEFERAYRDSEAYESSPYADDFVLFLQARSFLDRSLYSPACLVGWAVIEREVNRRFQREVLDRPACFPEGVSKMSVGEKEDVMASLPYWALPSPHVLAETRETRNEVAHGERDATKEDSEQLIDYARGLLEPRIKEALTGDSPSPGWRTTPTENR